MNLESVLKNSVRLYKTAPTQASKQPPHQNTAQQKRLIRRQYVSGAQKASRYPGSLAYNQREQCSVRQDDEAVSLSQRCSKEDTLSISGRRGSEQDKHTNKFFTWFMRAEPARGTSDEARAL